MTVEDVLTEATVLYLQQGKGHELEFISKSESSSLGWYFWLHGVDGVYEIEKKKELRPEAGSLRSILSGENRACAGRVLRRRTTSAI